MEKGRKESMTSGKRITLDIGTKVHLEIEGVAIPLASYLVGMDTEHYLIIKTPRPYPTIKSKLYEGNPCIVKYLFQDTVFAFQTRIVGSLTTPDRLIFLEYPRIFQHLDLRDFQRIECVIPTKIKVNKEEKEGSLVDVSAQGCRVQIPIYPGDRMPVAAINEGVCLAAQFPDGDGELEIRARVRNVRKSRHEIVLGVVYQDLSAAARETITRYLTRVEQLFPVDL